ASPRAIARASPGYPWCCRWSARPPCTCTTSSRCGWPSATRWRAGSPSSAWAPPCTTRFPSPPSRCSACRAARRGWPRRFPSRRGPRARRARSCRCRAAPSSPTPRSTRWRRGSAPCSRERATREGAIARPMGFLTAVVVSLRPRQWVKNFFVFAAVISSHQLFPPQAWRAAAAFALFCGLSGAIYLLNDVADAEKDRLHPEKRRRPVASGALSRGAALVIGLALLLVSLALSFALGVRFGLVALAYGVLLSAYSVRLKHLVILDVLTVAVGFVLRAVAGAVAVDADISGWLLICTVLIALFLALGKRRHEYLTLHGDAASHRPILAEYSEGFIDQMIAVVTASTVTAYALYTMSP